MNTQLIEKQIRELKQEKSVLKQMLILENIKDEIYKQQTTLKKKLWQENSTMQWK